MKKSLLIFLILCSIHFWRYQSFSKSIFNLTDLFSLLIMVYGLFKVIQKPGMRFKWPVLLLVIGILLNVLTVNINHGQPIWGTFVSFGPFFFILFYFFLHNMKIDIKELEDVVIFFAILYSVFYLIQVSVFPTRLFDGLMYWDRGTLRLRIEGNGFLVLGYFILLNRYMLKHKIIHVILAFAMFLILLQGGFRTLTVAAVLMSGILLIRLVKYSIINYLLIVIAVVLFMGLLQFEGPSRIVSGMVNATDDQLEQGEDYIRVRTYNFFTKEYPKNFSYYIFGGGLPGSSPYGRYIRYIEGEYGFYWVDLGLIGFYLVIGLIATLGIMGYSLKGVFSKVPPENFYLNVYFAYLIIVSFTTMEIYRGGMLGVEAIGLYLIDKSMDMQSNNSFEYDEGEIFEK